MAEIIDFEKFKKKKTGEEKEVKKADEKKEPAAESEKSAEIDPYLTECRRLFVILMRIFPEDKGRTLVNQMLHATSGREPHLVADMREVVKNYTTEELVRWLTEHPEPEWMSKPAFFHSIAEEIEKRIRYAADNIKK